MHKLVLPMVLRVVLGAIALVAVSAAHAASCGWNIPHSTWLYHQHYSSTCPGGARVEYLVCENNVFTRLNGEVKSDHAIHNNNRYTFTSPTTSIGTFFCDRSTGTISPFGQPSAGTVPLYYTGLVNAGPANRAPTVQNAWLTLQEDSKGTLTLVASDPDAGDSHTFTIVGGPAVGFASIGANKLNYTPPPNWNGTTSLSYRAVDVAGVASNIATVTITVTPVNDPPNVEDVALTIDEDTQGTVTLSVYDIDLSYEGDTHTFAIVSQPGAGSATLAGRIITYIPPVNWYGSTSMIYKVTDAAGATDTATIRIVVNPVNDPPVAQNKSLTINEDSTGHVILTATDVDSPTPNVFQIVNRPDAAIGSVSLAGSTATFVPFANWNGQSSFTYRAQDTSGAWSAPATVSITVIPVNDTPAAVNKITIRTQESRSTTVKTAVSH